MYLDKKAKVPGKDLRVQLCWGIDYYTQKNLFDCIPSYISIEDKHKFVGLQLIKCLNWQGDQGWNIKAALVFLLKESKNPASSLNFGESDVICAKRILRVMEMKVVETKKMLKTVRGSSQSATEGGENSNSLPPVSKDLMEVAFQFHTKGQGVLCTKYRIKMFHYLPLASRALSVMSSLWNIWVRSTQLGVGMRNKMS
jgi:hypothetical protein